MFQKCLNFRIESLSNKQDTFILDGEPSVAFNENGDAVLAIKISEKRLCHVFFLLGSMLIFHYVESKQMKIGSYISNSIKSQSIPVGYIYIIIDDNYYTFAYIK